MVGAKPVAALVTEVKDTVSTFDGSAKAGGYDHMSHCG